jgi:hypothetical protein
VLAIALAVHGLALSCSGMQEHWVALYGVWAYACLTPPMQPNWCPALARRFQYEWLV